MTIIIAIMVKLAIITTNMVNFHLKYQITQHYLVIIIINFDFTKVITKFHHQNLNLINYLMVIVVIIISIIKKKVIKHYY